MLKPFAFPIAVLLYLCAIGSPVHSSESTPLKPKRPNVIMIMADDMGYEALECNGGTSYSTELLNQFAREGMRFTNCYSQPVCTPSRNKIMTGRSNARNYKSFSHLDPNEITFGHVMREAGYKTCVSGKWQLKGGYPGSPYHNKGVMPEQCGFDQNCIWPYQHYLKPEDRAHYLKNMAAPKGFKRHTSRYWDPGILQNGEYRPTTVKDYGPDIFCQFILDFIAENQQNEFFVYYPMTLTHDPFVPTPHTKGLTDDIKFNDENRYFEDMVQYTGFLVKKIQLQLEALGLAENTLILFTTDNGTHRSVTSYMGDRVIPGGKGLPIDAGCHVPMIAYWKGKIKPGTLCTDLIDFSDFMPTIAEVGKAELPTDRILDGRSFLPQLMGEKGTPRETIVLHYDKDPWKEKPGFRRVRYAYNGRYKLYRDGLFYDLKNDIEEEHPIPTDGVLIPELSQIKLELENALKKLPAWKPDNSNFPNHLDPGTQKRLQKLNRLRDETAPKQ